MDTYVFVYVTIFLVALVQIPIAVDLLRFLLPQWRVARLASKAVHSILFVVMGTIFCIGLGYHLFVYLPLLANNDPLRSVAGILHTCFALWIWINMVGNYYFAVFLHPGRTTVSRDRGTNTNHAQPQSSMTEGAAVPQQQSQAGGPRMGTQEPRIVITSDDNVSSVRSRQGQPGGLGARTSHIETDPVELHHPQVQNGHNHPMAATPYIVLPPRPKTGLEWQPKRTQYCKICESAVPYLDHHCPFTGNCTGMRNYSNFYVGLWYGVVGLAYASAITLPYFFDCDLKNIFWYFGLIRDRQRSQVCLELGAHTHIFLPVFAGFVVSFNMLFLQTVFLLADVSTYNVLKNWQRFPMLRFMRERISSRKYRDPDSRWNVLIASQRPSLLWYLIPASNNFFR